jgi:membrane associated rhomboid family serine protease
MGNTMDSVIGRLAFVPRRGLQQPACRAQGAPLEYVISMFLHAGWLHLGGNMLYLWIFGNNIEDAMGRVKFTLFYFVCGLAAFTMAYMDPSSRIPMVGASGAISGTLAATSFSIRARASMSSCLSTYLLSFQNQRSLGGGLLVCPAVGQRGARRSTQPGVAWWAHVGGFAAGVVLTPFLSPATYRCSARPPGPWT